MLNKTHNQSNTLSQRRTGKVRRLYFSAVLMLALCAALACPALAADTDPLTIVNNLSDFLFLYQGHRRHHLRLGHRPTGYVHPVSRRQPAHPGHPLRVRRLAHRFFQGDFVRYRRGVTCHAEVQQNYLLYRDTLWSMEDDRTDAKRENSCTLLLRLFQA